MTTELDLLEEFRLFAGLAAVAADDLADALADALEQYANPLLREFPTIRQVSNFDCGAACMHAMGQYYGVGPGTEQAWIELLGTTREDGTSTTAMIREAKKLGLRVVYRDGMALETLAAWTREAIPVICQVQAYGSYAQEQAGDSGHYVVVLAADADEVTLMDPSAGRATVAAERFRQYWYDADADGRSYYHFGMAIWKEGRPVARSVSVFRKSNDCHDPGTGQFCSTGGDSAAGSRQEDLEPDQDTQDRWDKEDSERDGRQERERDQLEAQHAKEDRQIERQRGREDVTREREREKEVAAEDSRYEREGERYERQKDKEREAEADAVERQRDQEWDLLEARGASQQELDALTQRFGDEDTVTIRRQNEEDKKFEQEAHDRNVQRTDAINERYRNQQEEAKKRREHEDEERDRRHSQEMDALNARHAAEDEAVEAARELELRILHHGKGRGGKHDELGRLVSGGISLRRGVDVSISGRGSQTLPARSGPRQAYAKQWLKRHGQGERNLTQALKALYVAAGQAVAKNVAAGGDGGFDPQAFFGKIQAVVRPYAGWLLAEGAWTEWQANRPRSSHGVKDESVGKPAWKPGHRHPMWQELPLEIREAIEEEGEEILSKPYWKDLPETVRKDIAQALVKGTEEGDSDADKAKRIEALLGEDGSAARAKCIARSESTALLNAGHQASRDRLTAMGVVKGKEWLGIDDDVQRPSHTDADGQQVDNDAKFQVGDEEAEYPGDPDLSAGERVNCRCTAISVLADEEGEESQ